MGEGWDAFADWSTVKSPQGKIPLITLRFAFIATHSPDGTILFKRNSDRAFFWKHDLMAFSKFQGFVQYWVFWGMTSLLKYVLHFSLMLLVYMSFYFMLPTVWNSFADIGSKFGHHRMCQTKASKQYSSKL